MVRRGEIWTAAGGGDYADKPRPVVILQGNQFDGTESVTVCGLTTDLQPIGLFRVGIEPNDRNHLAERSYAMLDKIYTVRRRRLGYRLGELDRDDIRQIERAIVLFLAIAADGS